MFFCRNHDSQTPRSEIADKASEVYQIKKRRHAEKPVHGVLSILNPIGLLPLDSRAWLWREVVADAVDHRDFGEDTVGDLHEDRPFDLLDACCHCVDSVDGADDYRPVIGAGIVAYTY